MKVKEAISVLELLNPEDEIDISQIKLLTKNNQPLWEEATQEDIDYVASEVENLCAKYKFDEYGLISEGHLKGYTKLVAYFYELALIGAGYQIEKDDSHNFIEITSAERAYFQVGPEIEYYWITIVDGKVFGTWLTRLECEHYCKVLQQ